MICYQYQCQECGEIIDQYFNMSERPVTIQCLCGGIAKRIISIPGANMVNESPNWVRDVLEVVEKGSNKRHCNEFLKNPTRSNLRTWMKKEGLRHMEPGEKPTKPKQKEITPEQLMAYRQQKRSLTLRS